MGCGASSGAGGGSGGATDTLSFAGGPVPQGFYKQAGVGALILSKCEMHSLPTGMFTMDGLETLDVGAQVCVRRLVHVFTEVISPASSSF
jgi:hypothetical protein